MDVAEHRRLGGRTAVDVSYQYLSYFLEDDTKLQEIHDTYECGELLTGELKKIAITEIWAYVNAFQARRAKITDEILKMFMDGKRPLRLNKRYNWEDKKKFVAGETVGGGFPEELVGEIMMYVPLSRASELLYLNGEMSPEVAALEVELYRRNAEKEGLYVGCLRGGEKTVECFEEMEEVEKRIAELKIGEGGKVVVVVDGLKK